MPELALARGLTVIEVSFILSLCDTNIIDKRIQTVLKVISDNLKVSKVLIKPSQRKCDINYIQMQINSL